MTARNDEASANRTITVVGAGGVGLAMAGHLALSGYSVHLFDPEPHRTESVAANGGIMMHGWSEGLGRLAGISHDPARAFANTDCALFTIPQSAFRTMVEKLAPHLGNLRYLIAVPGCLGGALELADALNKASQKNIVVGEFSHVPLLFKMHPGAMVKVKGPQSMTTFATLPTGQQGELGELLLPAFPWLSTAPNVLSCGLGNPEPLFLATLTVLNALRIESGENFDLWQDLTNGALSMLEMVDRERASVATSLGVQVLPAQKYYQTILYSDGGKLGEILNGAPTSFCAPAPHSLEHVFFNEYIPYYLVPLHALGEKCGVAPYGVDALIRLASALGRSDLRRRGRSLEAMGLAGKNPSDIKKYLAAS